MASNTARRPVDIYIVGLGIRNVQQITREAEQAIQLSKKVFTVHAGFGLDEFLKTLCPDVRSLVGKYEEGGDRLRTYRAMAAEVLNAALDDSPVCFASYGHPKIYVYPTNLIEKAAPLLGLTVRVLPGISALDTILADLGLDPGPNGLQMYEATDLLARERPLQPDVPCLLWQVSAVESAMYSTKRGNAERYRRLQDFLVRTYPPGHQLTMVLSPTYALLEPLKETFPVGELAERLARGLQIGTLYIPPTHERAISNPDLLREAFEAEHLDRITTAS
ncbi:SAM-dependent methyltransferase [Streptacidiphilus neutrinimicus]|uniref:SAM-dependent methyltransferase n=1 Tax=Streptacidiphilus neutrinimicus TaxID=105420 RepID=UPI0005AAA1C4|nr:SAM-dependent methyltransferase [Streptacidiphilus neutrinimicus]